MSVCGGPDWKPRLKQRKTLAFKQSPICAFADPIGIKQVISIAIINEHHCEKIGLLGFRPGPTQTRLYSHRRWLEA